jgi:hypothetical protein
MQTEVRPLAKPEVLQSPNRRDWLDLAIAAGILILVAVFFYKTVFLGMPISKINMLAEWDVMFGSQRKGDFILGLDLSGILSNIPYYFLISKILHSGNLPLWNPYSGCGFPLVGDIESTAFAPLRFIFALCPTLAFYNRLLVAEVAVAAVGSYFLARALQLPRYASVFAALTYTFCPYILFFLELSLGSAYVLFPLLFLAFVRAAAKPVLLRSFIAGGAAALVIMSGHPESAFFGIITAGLLMLVLGLTSSPDNRSRWLIIRAFIAAAISAFMFSAPVLLPFLELLTSSACYKFTHAASFAMPWQAIALNLVEPVCGAGSQFLGALALAMLSAAIFSGRKLAYCLLGTAAFMALVVCQIGPVGWILQHTPLHVIVTVYGTPALLLLLSLAAAVGFTECVETTWSRALPKNIAIVSTGLLTLGMPLILKTAHVDISHYGFDFALRVPSWSYSAWNLNAVALGAFAVPLVISYFRPAIGKWLLIAVILIANFGTQAHIATNALPTRNNFEYKLDAPGPFLQQKERIMTVGQHIMKPNSQEPFGISNIAAHKSLFPARYIEFVQAAGGETGMLDQSFSENIHGLLDVAAIKYVLSTAPVHSIGEPRPKMQPSSTENVVLGQWLRLVSASSNYSANDHEVAVELSWDVKKTKHKQTYMPVLYDSDGGKVWYGETYYFPVQTQTPLKMRDVIAVPLRAKEGQHLRLGLEVFDWQTLKYLSPPGGLTVSEFTVGPGSTNDRDRRFILKSESTSGIRLYENTKAAPEAYLVHQMIVAKTPEDALKTIGSPSFDWRKTVVVDGVSQSIADGVTVAGPVSESVTVSRPSTNKVSVEFNSGANGVLVLNDTFYPGWSARIDGERAPILHANYLFRAVKVPAGKHRIDFAYEPASFYIGAALFGVAVLCMVLLLFANRIKRIQFTVLNKIPFEKLRSQLVSSPVGLPLSILVVLVALEALWFGPILPRVGFYLDDWRTYADLYFSGQSWQSLLSTEMNDPRLVTRPLEAVFFVLSYLSFGCKPLGHHLINCAFEVLASWLLYLCMYRLSRNRTISFLAAVILLIHPSHDATHYWATANAITLSLMLWFVSWWQTLKAVQDFTGVKRFIWQLAGALTFLSSLLIYEAFLPLCGVNILCSAVLSFRREDKWRSLLGTGILSAMYASTIALIYWFQRIYLSNMGKGLQHPAHIEPMHFVKVIAHGFENLFSVDALRFLYGNATAYLPNAGHSIILAAFVIVALASLRLLFGTDRKFSHPFAFIGLGLITMTASYTIFGITQEYWPELHSIYNRINYGGCVGASMVIAGIFGVLMDLAGRVKISSFVPLLICCIPLFTFFILADWGLAIPWKTSWTCQREVLHKLRARASEIKSGDCILLAHNLRYVLWSPCFDGIWDFKPALRYTINNKNIDAGVLSDRIAVSQDSLKDVTVGFVCATYPYQRLFSYVALTGSLSPITNAQDFMKLVRKESATWAEYRNALPRWEKEFASIKPVNDQ